MNKRNIRAGNVSTQTGSIIATTAQRSIQAIKTPNTFEYIVGNIWSISSALHFDSLLSS